MLIGSSSQDIRYLTPPPSRTSRQERSVTQPTPEMARDMVQDVVSKSIVQWYAYGLLEAPNNTNWQQRMTAVKALYRHLEQCAA